MTASTPICGRMPQIGAMIMPAIAASMAPNTKTSSRSRVRLMPSARTISLSWAPAFTVAPNDVFSIRSQTSPMIATAMPAA